MAGREFFSLARLENKGTLFAQDKKRQSMSRAGVAGVDAMCTLGLARKAAAGLFLRGGFWGEIMGKMSGMKGG